MCIYVIDSGINASDTHINALYTQITFKRLLYIKVNFKRITIEFKNRYRIQEFDLIFQINRFQTIQFKIAFLIYLNIFHSQTKCRSYQTM